MHQIVELVVDIEIRPDVVGIQLHLLIGREANSHGYLIHIRALIAPRITWLRISAFLLAIVLRIGIGVDIHDPVDHIITPVIEVRHVVHPIFLGLEQDALRIRDHRGDATISSAPILCLNRPVVGNAIRKRIVVHREERTNLGPVRQAVSILQLSTHVGSRHLQRISSIQAGTQLQPTMDIESLDRQHRTQEAKRHGVGAAPLKFIPRRAQEIARTELWSQLLRIAAIATCLGRRCSARSLLHRRMTIEERLTKVLDQRIIHRLPHSSKGLRRIRGHDSQDIATSDLHSLIPRACVDLRREVLQRKGADEVNAIDVNPFISDARLLRPLWRPIRIRLDGGSG